MAGPERFRNLPYSLPAMPTERMFAYGVIQRDKVGKPIWEGGFQAREGRGLYAPRKPPSLQVGYWGRRGSGDGHACPSHPLQRLGPDTFPEAQPR